MIEYLASAVIAVLPNSSAGPSIRTQTYFLLSEWTDRPLATPKIKTFSTNLPFGNERVERALTLRLH